MASPYKLVGYTFQIIGMIVMFFGFIMLIVNIQKVVSRVTSDIGGQSNVLGKPPVKCDPKTDEMCGVDFAKEGSTEQIFSKKIYNFIFYLGVGLFLVFLGVFFRATEEIAATLTGLKKKDDNLKIPVGRWYGPRGKGPFSP